MVQATRGTVSVSREQVEQFTKESEPASIEDELDLAKQNPFDFAETFDE